MEIIQAPSNNRESQKQVTAEFAQQGKGVHKKEKVFHIFSAKKEGRKAELIHSTRQK